MIKAIFNLIRVRQYTKNSFIFVPLIFSQATLAVVLGLLPKSLLAFTSFCLISSTAYIINDIFNAPKDSLHPVKAKRPIASGQIASSFAWALAGAAFLGLLAVGLALSSTFILVILIYLANNLLYSFSLKQYALFDIFSLSLGFLLRIFAGTVAIKVPVSAYLF